jgi:hypothetical protein
MRIFSNGLAGRLGLLALAAGCSAAQAARFTDPFNTPPGTPDREPFVWDQFNAYQGAGSVWRAVEGRIEYLAQEQTGTASGLGLGTAGIDITDQTRWSLEVGFRHVSGEVPPDYLFIAYTRWYTADAGRMRIVGLNYDPAKHEIGVYNSVRLEGPIAADLSGDFHALRLAVAERKLRLYVDGKLVGGPYELQDRAYGASEEFLCGPMTETKAHSLHCQWDYLAFTDEGAFAPGEGDWTPGADREPVARGLNIVRLKNLLNQPPYPGLKVVSKQKGRARWQQALPETMRLYRSVIDSTPGPLEVDFYQYPDQTGPSRQNIYQNPFVLQYDERRCVANAMLTRGIGDTATGFMDYKMWYRVSLDGGKAYSALRPIVQQGPGYSPMHPIEYVYVGKNSFCYATIPGVMLKLSNGKVFFPCYYAPLNEQGEYYNPLNAYTFSWVVGIIGTWNEAGTDLLWEVSAPVKIDADQSSRGADECAVIELAGQPGHLLMVIRGSNEPNPTGKIPAYKWRTVSTDYGKTWSRCEPFTFEDGEAFPSPSSCCSFIRSSRTKTCYWVGNISRQQPRGNWPRYPLVIAVLDEETLCLRRETVTIIDDRLADDPPDLQLSNYNLIEDETTGDLVLEVNRMVSGQGSPGSGSHTYVIRVQ